MFITTFGSCRQHSIGNHFNLTSIQETLAYPHYTKEIIQAIEYCKRIHKFDNKYTRYCFRSGILDKREITYQSKLQEEFDRTDLFIIEIASRISYEWNNLYVHHILTEEQYEFHDIPAIKQRDLTDDEIEADILQISKLLFPKKILIVPHIYTRYSGKRYELVKLLEKITNKYNIPFINPSELLKDKQNVYADNNHFTNYGHQLIGEEYKKVINNLVLKKTVVMPIKQSYYNYPDSFWGFGDILRGIIGMHQLSKKYNFDLIVDFSLHQIGKIIKSYNHKYYNKMLQEQEQVQFLLSHQMDSTINNNLINSINDVLFVTTNMDLNTYNSMDNHTRLFLNNILQFNDDFNKYVEEKMKRLQKNYNVIHYRLGDDEIKNSNMNEEKYERVYRHLLSIYNKNDIVISDSIMFKKYIASKNSDILIEDTKIGHTGYEESLDAIKDTIYEFNLLKNAKLIKSYSTYGWISGFVQIVNKLFDVLLEGHINCGL